MRSASFRLFLATLTVLTLLLAFILVVYQQSLNWPLVCMFSDLKSLIFHDPADRFLFAWRLAFSALVGALLALLCWTGLRWHKKTGYVFLPVMIIVVLLVAIIFYPSLRAAALAAVVQPDPTMIAIEAVDPESPHPVQLTLGTPPSEVAWESDVMWFTGADACHIELPREILRSLATSSGLLRLPPEVAPDAGFAHDWLRLSLVTPHIELNVMGTRVTGRHSGRLRRTATNLFKGAYISEVAHPPCVDRLERILEIRK